MKLKPQHYIAGIAIIGAIYWLYPNEQSSDAINGYQTKALSTGDIVSLVNASGTLSPVVTVEVGSELSGLVSELNADYNSEVTRGQIIARIDDRTIRARLKQNEADLAASNASLTQQKANRLKAKADLKLAKSEYARQKELRVKGLSSQSDLDKAEATFLIAEAQLELSYSQITAAEATVLQRKAQVEQTRLDLERTYIRSPVNGTVIDRQVDVGQTVAASFSAPVLFQIAQDLTKMQIETDVDEADIGKVAEGLPVRFSVDAFPDRHFTGEITQVRKASTVTSNVVTYKVIISAGNPEQKLLPGMTANVDIILDEKNQVLRVDNSALRFSPLDTKNRKKTKPVPTAYDSAAMRPGQVWVLKGGKPAPIEVTVGLSNDQYTEIQTAELKDGDEVILRPARNN